MELVCGKPLNLLSSFSYYLKMPSAKYGVSMSISDVTVAQYLNISTFRPEKGVLDP